MVQFYSQFQFPTLPEKAVYCICTLLLQLGCPPVKDSAVGEKCCRWQREYALGILTVQGRKETDLLFENVSICA